jgi:alpha-L-rhamnosidase
MFSMKSNLRQFLSKYFFSIVLVQFVFLVQILNASSNPELKNLRSEYKTNPVGIDVLLPRLSWEIISSKRNFIQQAYQIRAAASEKDLTQGKNLLWDSGKIESEQSNQIVYSGKPLESGKRIYWQVKIWEKDGSVSDWSEPAFWEMGLLKTSDWRAKWIEPQLNEIDTVYNPCPMLRKEFEIKKEIKSARAYVTCHGLYEFHLNGDKVSDQLLTPGWTSYNKRLQYQVYDISKNIAEGKNALGVILGDGWYRGPLKWDMKRNNYGNKLALLLQIIIEYNDGTTEIIGTDNSWKSSTGPILMSGIYNGEIYDARLEKTGWDKSNYDDKNWSGTIEKDFAKNILIASEGPAVKITQSIKPINKFTAPNGDLIFDMGQNMVGWIQIKLKGNAGQKITLKHVEVLDQDGNIYTKNLRRAKQEIEYTFKGNDVETFEPHFTFQGFRYVAVRDFKGEISLDNITGKVIHSDMTPSGNFECSDSLINKLQKNIQWGLRGNFVDVPTDCPQRDERLGWTGDAQTFAPTACFNMDAASFYTKWMKDFIADQLNDGRFPHVVPDVLTNEGGAAGWADAGIIVPWTLYLNYGDTRILETQYESMKKWIEYLKNLAGDSYLWNRSVGYGDWLAFATTSSDYPGATTDKDLIGTAYFYYSTSLIQKIASILGKEQDVKDYAELMKNIKNVFQKEFITQTGRVASNTQTAYVLALDFNLIPENLKAEAAKRLADDVDKFEHITTGFLGASRVCKTLTDHGYNDLAFMLLFNRKYPSWLYPVTKGATTIWERWDGIKRNGSFQDEGMNSFNHYAYGAVGKWIYGFIAGMDIDPDKPGFKNIIMNPNAPKELKFAKTNYHSIFGDIFTSWETKNDSFIFDVQVPANTTADVFLPTDVKEKISEGGKSLDTIKEIQFMNSLNGKTLLHIGSGKYHFEVKK